MDSLSIKSWVARAYGLQELMLCLEIECALSHLKALASFYISRAVTLIDKHDWFQAHRVAVLS